jgi:hypothetical protein
MSFFRAFDYFIVIFAVVAVTVVLSEACLAVLGMHSAGLYAANFILLELAVVFAIPLGAYCTYSWWRVTRSYLA